MVRVKAHTPPRPRRRRMPAPANLLATATGTTITLSWSAETGAASYNVYRGTTAGGEGTTAYKTGITTTTFGDSGLAMGTTYYYFVTAVDGAGESGHSSETSATTVAPAPANLLATATGTTIVLSWAGGRGDQLQHLSRNKRGR